MIGALIRDRRGGAAVEFALIAPVLLVMLAGILEYGQVMAARQAIRDVIDGAVRQGVVQVQSSTAVQETVEGGLAAMPAVRDFTVDVTDGLFLAVTVTASYDLVLGAFLPDEFLSFQMTTQLHR